MNVHAENKKQFKCKLCPKAFSQKTGLTKHIQGQKPFKCHYWDKCFAYTGTRIHHTINEHELEKKLPCPTCGKLFGLPKWLEDHENAVLDILEICSRIRRFLYSTIYFNESIT